MASKSKKEYSSIIWAHLTTVILFSAIFYSGVFQKNGLIDYLELRQLLQEKKNTISSLSRSNVDLKEEINRLTNDSRYVERIARQELGLLRDNEVIFIFKK